MEKDKKKNLPVNIENSLKTRKETTAQKKKRFIKAYSTRLCNVSKACEVIGISRNAYYQWLDKDDAFKKEINIANEELCDILETTMLGRAITDKSDTMLIWLSKTKMKHRGYVEKQEQEITLNPLEEVMKRVAVRKQKEDE